MGGGFTPLLHSVIEPLVYGIPVAFGPKTGRKYITSVMQTRGIGTIVDDSSSICAWWDRIISGNVDMKKIKRESEDLCSHNQGSRSRSEYNNQNDRKVSSLSFKYKLADKGLSLLASLPLP